MEDDSAVTARVRCMENIPWIFRVHEYLGYTYSNSEELLLKLQGKLYASSVRMLMCLNEWIYYQFFLPRDRDIILFSPKEPSSGKIFNGSVLA